MTEDPALVAAREAVRTALMEQAGFSPRLQAFHALQERAPRSAGGPGGNMPFTPGWGNQVKLAALLEAVGAGGFLKDVGGDSGVPTPGPGQGVVLTGGALANTGRVWTPNAITTRNPQPTLFWSQPQLVCLVVGSITNAGATAASATEVLTKTVTLKAHGGNADRVRVRSDGTAPTTTNGYSLSAGDVQVYPVRDLADIQFIAETGGGNNEVDILYIPEDA